MAEIKIEKKSPIWLWVLLAVVAIGLLLYFLLSGNEEENQEAVAIPTAIITETGSDTGAGNAGAISAYVQFVETQDMDKNHAYVNGALERLTVAVESKAQQLNFDVSADLDKVRAYAKDITSDASAATHADKLKNAATILAGVMERMQQAHYQNLQSEAAEVENAAADISGSELLLNQKDAVQSFFSESSQLLQKMS